MKQLRARVFCYLAILYFTLCGGDLAERAERIDASTGEDKVYSGEKVILRDTNEMTEAEFEDLVLIDQVSDIRTWQQGKRGKHRRQGSASAGIDTATERLGAIGDSDWEQELSQLRLEAAEQALKDHSIKESVEFLYDESARDLMHFSDEEGNNSEGEDEEEDLEPLPSTPVPSTDSDPDSLTSERFPNAANQFLKAVFIIASAAFSVFFVWQYHKCRAGSEELYVTIISTILRFTETITGSALFWVETPNGIVPLGRYFSWLLVCPVTLSQLLKLHVAAGYTSYRNQLNFLIILQQIMIVFGAFASVSVDVQKWLFFILGSAAGVTYFIQLYLMYYENKRHFPEDVRSPLLLVTVFFILTWVVYPALWVTGTPGFGFLDQNWDTISHVSADLLSKLALTFAIWYVRWNYLGNESVTNTGRILRTRRVHGASTDKFGLTEEEVLNAQEAPFNILLLDKDILVHKAVLLMMEVMSVDVVIAFDTIHALEHLENNPSYLFDCVLVVPEHHTTPLEKQALKDLSQLIIKDPYKIPMLAMYFGLDKNLPEPGEYIHGIIQRPLDELSFFQDLYNWRLTANMWRRVALTMENIESDADLFPKLEDLPEEAQTAMMKSSMDVRRRGSLFGQTLFNQQGANVIQRTQEGQDDLTRGLLHPGEQGTSQPYTVAPAVPGGEQGETENTMRWRHMLANYNQQ